MTDTIRQRRNEARAALRDAVDKLTRAQEALLVAEDCAVGTAVSAAAGKLARGLDAVRDAAARLAATQNNA